MNDPTYVEASRKLAERLLTEAGPTAGDRIALAFRLILARKPSQDELQVCQRIYQRQASLYQHDPDAAARLLTVGESETQ